MASSLHRQTGPHKPPLTPTRNDYGERITIEAFSLDSTRGKVHPNGTGALKMGPRAIGKSRGDGTPRFI